MTINNYNENDFESFQNENNMEYVVGKEVGTNDTPHLQIYIEFKNARTFKSVKNKWPKAHIEKAKGNAQQNFDYCVKDGDFITNMKLKKSVVAGSRHARILKKYDGVKWKSWQKNIIDICQEDPDERIINWIYDEKGNIGKSFLAKFLVLKFDAIICSGKTADVANQVNIWLEKNPEEDPKVIIMDVPRSSLGYINYTCLEQLKNGMMYSGKYEGGVCIFDNPHVFVFANEKPNMEAMSLDRWNIIEVSGATA